MPKIKQKPTYTNPLSHLILEENNRKCYEFTIIMRNNTRVRDNERKPVCVCVCICMCVQIKTCVNLNSKINQLLCFLSFFFFFQELGGGYGRLNDAPPPANDKILILETCEYVALYFTRDFAVVIKVMDLKISRLT